MNSTTFETLRRWVVVFAVALVFFYGMDQLLMSAQGLPLGWTLAPQN